MFAPHPIKEYPWQDFNWNDYNKRNYDHPCGADILLANKVIDALANLGLTGTYHTAFEIGACASLRSAGSVAPLLSETGVYTFSDVTPILVNATREAVHNAAEGRLGRWLAHQDAMARHNPDWRDCIENVCRKAEFSQKNIFKNLYYPSSLQIQSTQIAVAGHTLESITDNREEYARGFTTWANSLVLGTPKKPSIGVMYYTVGSNGYKDSSDGLTYPAVPVYPQDIELNARTNRLEVVMSEWVPKNPEEDVRDPQDATTYAGLGAAVMLKYR